jgi:hypothetical protein
MCYQPFYQLIYKNLFLLALFLLELQTQAYYIKAKLAKQLQLTCMLLSMHGMHHHF